jgi:hypothetical protein
MKNAAKRIGAMAAAVVLAGCAEQAGLGINTLSVGEQVSVRTLLAENPGKRACTEYDAASNSCASLITSRISGNTLIGSEVASVRGVGGAPQRIEVITRSRINGAQACVTAEGVQAGRGSSNKEAAAFVVSFTKELIKERGGVCGTYFRAGDGYVVRSTGRDGKPFPPGDTVIRFVGQGVSLRAQ